MNIDEMKIFLVARKHALLSMDKEIIKSYALKYGIKLPEDEETFWCAIHKARTADKQLSFYQRQKSEKWLIERGYKPALCE